MSSQRMKLSRLGAFVRRGGGQALFPLFFSLALAVTWWTTNEELRLLQLDGVDTTATVLEKFESSSGVSGTRGNRSSSSSYHVKLQFVDSAGQRLIESTRVGSSFYLWVDEGDEIPVRYVERDPSVVEADPELRDTLWYWISLVGLLMLVWLVGALWHYWRESAKTYRAVTEGEVREARVTGHVSDANPRVVDTRKESKRRYKLKWRDSTEKFGMGGSLRQGELVKYPEGTLIITYTDPVSGETFWEGQI